MKEQTQFNLRTVRTDFYWSERSVSSDSVPQGKDNAPSKGLTMAYFVVKSEVGGPGFIKSRNCRVRGKSGCWVFRPPASGCVVGAGCFLNSKGGRFLEVWDLPNGSGFRMGVPLEMSV